MVSMTSKNINVGKASANPVHENAQYIGGDRNILETILKDLEDLAQLRRDVRDIKSHLTNWEKNIENFGGLEK